MYPTQHYLQTWVWQATWCMLLIMVAFVLMCNFKMWLIMWSRNAENPLNKLISWLTKVGITLLFKTRFSQRTTAENFLIHLIESQPFRLYSVVPLLLSVNTTWFFILVYTFSLVYYVILKKIRTSFCILAFRQFHKILYVACSPAVIVESFVATMKRKHVLPCSCVCHVFSYSFRPELC